MEPPTTDRIQRMIDAEATERFPPGVVPQLALLHCGDYPVIEPENCTCGSSLGQDGATRDALITAGIAAGRAEAVGWS